MQEYGRIDRDSGKSFSPMKDIVFFLFFGKFSCQILVIQLKFPKFDDLFLRPGV